MEFKLDQGVGLAKNDVSQIQYKKSGKLAGEKSIKHGKSRRKKFVCLDYQGY
jgi:hypothetical protein